MIDVCVPTWNSLEYLKILHKSLQCNFKINYKLIVHDNGSNDGVLDFCRSKGIECTRSDENIGFCGVNKAIQKGSNDYVLIANTDMYFLPFSDIELVKQIKKFEKDGINKFTISCCLIEPLGQNPEYVISYHGHDYKTFNEEDLIKDYLSGRNNKYNTHDTIQYSHPILIPRKFLDEMNFLDEKYFPGWSVDHDIPAKAYSLGCRHFKMLAKSRVYHFISKTFTQLPKNVKNMHGEDIFQKKWGFSVKEFRDKLQIATSYKRVNDGLF